MTAPYKFDVGKRIGKGGQASVFEMICTDGVKRAIKIFREPPGPADGARERFIRETHLLSGLHHPGIVQIVPHTMHPDGTPAYIMPWADGDLSDVLKQRGHTMSSAEALQIFDDIINAIEHMHNANIIHRDIKPANILVFGTTYKVSDFGYSRRIDENTVAITQTNHGFGTPGYVAPEQWDNAKAVDITTDIYSLGVLLFQLLTNEPANEPRNINLVPERYRDVVVRATSKEPASRYSSVAELRAAIARRSRDDAQHAPSEQFHALMNAVADQPWNYRPALDVLVRHQDDQELYLTNLTAVSQRDLQIFQQLDLVEYTRVIDRYLQLIEGQHPFARTDTYAYFLQLVWSISTDAQLKQRVLKGTLLLGYNHNRWAVRTVFGNMAADAFRDQAQVFALADMLAENRDACIFVKPILETKQGLPNVIRNVLNEHAEE